MGTFYFYYLFVLCVCIFSTHFLHSNFNWVPVFCLKYMCFLQIEYINLLSLKYCSQYAIHFSIFCIFWYPKWGKTLFGERSQTPWECYESLIRKMNICTHTFANNFKGFMDLLNFIYRLFKLHYSFITLSYGS